MKHLRFEDRVSEMRKQDQDKVNELAMGNWKGYSAYKIETASGFSGSLRIITKEGWFPSVVHCLTFNVIEEVIFVLASLNH